MAMEALSYILKGAMEGSFLESFLASGRGGMGMVVSYFLFADDMLILCDSNKEHLEFFSWAFMWFKAISDLKK